MAELRLTNLADEELVGALGQLTGSVAWPAARLAPDGPDVATRVRARLVAGDVGRRPLLGRWPVRRALVLAILALALLAAVATAVVLGVPGIRIVFGEPPVTPPPATTAPPATSAPGTSPGPTASPGPPGATLGLGRSVPLDDVDELAGFDVRLPADPEVGPPAAVYLNAFGLVSVVWPAGESLPATADRGVGLLLTEFRGRVQEASITKMLDSGNHVVPVLVGSAEGYWISGDLHYYVYEAPDGQQVEDKRRWVGDVLIWNDGEITYRLETSLGRDAAIRIAETLE